jgi:hypothetical protein
MNGRKYNLRLKILEHEKNVVWEEDQTVDTLGDDGREDEAEEILEGAYVLVRMKLRL